MKKQNTTAIDPLKVSRRGSKLETQAALNEIGWMLQKLVHQQSLLIREQNLRPSDENVASQRLKIFESAMPDIVKAYEVLDDLIFTKQAGGKPVNRYFNAAYELTKAHYVENNSFIKSKALVKALNLKFLGKAEPYDKNGNGDAISERLAGDCIRLFKLCLPYEIFDDI